jgi:uncharacterized Zn finger protein
MDISPNDLKSFIDTRYIKRGEQIVQDKSIILERVSSESIQAYAIGTGIYKVTLSRSNTNQQLTGTCNCPAFFNFGPCKHIAATGLAYLNPRYKPDRWCLEQKKNFTRIKRLLASQTKAQLIETILKFIAQDQNLLEFFEEE